MVTNAPTQSLVPAAGQLRDIRPPVEIPSIWPYVWWGAGLMAVVVLTILALYLFRKRQGLPPIYPDIPAHVRARQKLEEALAFISDPKRFCTVVSDTIRFYLEERFSFHAPERTTEEFLYELQGTDLLLPDQKDSLGEFLKRCDLVKFARYEPRELELRDLHESACRLIDETEPMPMPAPAAGGVSPPPIPKPEIETVT